MTRNLETVQPVTDLPAGGLEAVSNGAGASRSWKSRASSLRRQNSLPWMQFVVLVGVYVYGAATIQEFTSASSTKSMLLLAALLGIAAAGPTLVLLLGGIDLAVPAYIALGASLTAQLYGTNKWPFPLVFVSILLLAGAFGALTGWLCRRFNLEPLIVTLAMGSVISGLLFAFTNGQVNGEVPEWLAGAVAPVGTTFGLPLPAGVVIWIVLAILIGLGLARTVSGRRLYATGTNPVAATYAGIKTRRVWIGTFAIAAMITAFSGILLAGFSGGADQSIGNPYLFQGLAAIIVGGVSFGARGNYLNTMAGALLLTVLGTILVGAGAGAAEQQVIYGLLILVVVGIYGRDKQLRERV